MSKYVSILFLCFVSYALHAQTSRTVNIAAGELWLAVAADEKAGVTALTVAGTMDARDFIQLRDSFPALVSLDLSNVSVAAYNDAGANTIPGSAFMNRTLLKSFILPKNLTAVAANAFLNCTAVTSIHFPASLTAVDFTSFRNFGGYFTVEAANTSFSANNGILYNKTQTELIQCPVSLTGDYTLPITLSTIKKYAFLGCKITSVLSPCTSPLTIEESAFQRCYTLTSFSTRASSTSTAIYSFENCTLLKDFEANTLTVGVAAFANCKSLGVFTPSIIKLEASAFLGCTKLESVLLVAPISEIPSNAFNGCREALISISLPSSVTRIGVNAFSNCGKLATANASKIVIDDSSFNNCVSLGAINASIDKIGNRSFYNCTNLTSLNISQTTSIGELAFFGCSKLPAVTISAAVVSIGNGAFRNCNAPITVAPGNAKYFSRDGVLFNKNMTRLIQSPTSNQGVYSVPEGVNIIGAYSFYGNKNLTKIEIPKSVCTIEASAFVGCGAALFIAPQNSCLYSPNGLVIYNPDSTALICCSPKISGNYTMPATVKEIYPYAFSGCNQLTSLKMNDGLQKIGANAFSEAGIKSIEIPATVTFLGDSAFFNCRNAVSAAIPSPNYISNYAFYGCANITNFTLPAALGAVGNYAFAGCSRWSGALALPASVTAIGKFAFSGCSALTQKLDIPPAITTVSDGAFDECSGFTELNIPPSVTSIGVYSFKNCNKITSVKISTSVKEIKNYAFVNCRGLTSVYADAVEPLDLSGSVAVFANVNKYKCTLFVPAGSKKSYQKAAQWKDFYHIIEGLGFWVDKDTVLLKSAASLDSVIIGSNTAWKTQVLAPNTAWLSSTPAEGHLDGKIFVKADENYGDKRTAYITVKTQDSMDTIVVIQKETSRIPNFDIKVKYLKKCGTQSYSFTAVPTQGGASNLTYEWSFGDGQTLSDTKNPVEHEYADETAKTYTITLTARLDVYRRSFTKRFAMEKLPVLMLDNKPKLCVEDTMIVHVKGAQKYTWSNGSHADSLIITSPGTYRVMGVNNDTLCSVKTFTVEANPTYNYVMESDVEQIKSYLPLLHIWSSDVSGSQYSWEFSDGGTAQGRDVHYLFKETKKELYVAKLIVVNPDGCRQTYSKLIEIVKADTPNTFTPNGDGVNDVFMKNHQLKVFDRLGQLLYDGAEGWDGTYKGRKMPRDTYFYVITFKTEAGVKNISNYVMLIR